MTGFENWHPMAQAAALAVLTLVQEDAPTASAALWSAAGQIGLIPAFLGCFFGIWVGDALLYLLARRFGRPMLHAKWAKRFFSATATARAEAWFAEKGTSVLLASRLIPGMRLPTYLVAGFLRVPFRKFLVVTGIAVAAWTIAIFLLARTVGSAFIDGFRDSPPWLFLLLIVALTLTMRLALKLANKEARDRFSANVAKWTHWEFWPAWLFYIPVIVNYLWLAMRYRGLTLPTAANPGIASGGVIGESKMVTLRDLESTSPEFTASGHLIDGNPEERRARLQRLVADGEVEFPFILKPDVGQRGVGVKLIRDWSQVEGYVRCTTAALICQAYAPGPHEVGVFYYRFPGQPHGHIFAITEKIFPTVTGDGVRTIGQLIEADGRARLIASKYLGRLGDKRLEVPQEGETFKLVEAGNHAQGCIFRDGMHLWSKELERKIDDISQRLNGFYIGRYDIRYASEASLRSGCHFQVIELNGAASEATSIYDARNSLFAAYRTLFRQWELVFAIGRANRQRGTPSTSLPTLWRLWRETATLVATYPAAD